MIPRIDRRASRAAPAHAASNGVAPGSGVAKVDMHCHSTASEAAKLGIQRSLGLPECATPPEES